MSYWNLVLMWYGHMTAEYISQLMTEKELLGSKKQAAIKYIADQMHKTHYGYANERDMPWWITALEIINNIPVSNNRVVLDTDILIGSPKDESLAMKNLSILNEELTKENKRLEKEYAKDTVHFHNKWMEAEANCKAYRQALERIAHPIAFMQEEARKEKCNLDGGIAIMLSRDPNYLKQIAEDALRGDE